MRKLKNYKPTQFLAEGSVYDKTAADYAVGFIECLCHTKGTWAGKPFELIDWQEQIIRDIFGTLKPNGYRQFNTAYIEIPKKMGKSELAAAVALLLCCGDGEERAEVYGCAADRQQASIVFEVAADMVKMCPALAKRVKILASQKRLVFLPTNSFYQVLSAEAYSKHGFNIHGVVFDELHTQPNRKLFDVMTKGSGDARMQPLYFLITTAGTDTHSICYETHQKALDILEGRKIDPTFYPVIYGADENDDWTDPKVWKKANPSLGITVGIDKVEAACESAKQNPAEENSFRQLRLNQWVKQAVRWMPMDKWDKCAFATDEDDLCKDFNIPIDTIPELKTEIKQIYVDKAVSEIISNILEFCGGGYNFDVTPQGLRIYKYGDIYAYPEFRITPNTPLIYSPSLRGNVSHSASIEDMKNSIKVITDADNVYTVQTILKDTDSIYKFGVLQEIVKIDPEKENAQTVAQTKLKELNSQTESFSFEMIEAVDSYTRAGMVMDIDEVRYLIEGTTHSITNGIHYVKVDLRRWL